MGYLVIYDCIGIGQCVLLVQVNFCLFSVEQFFFVCLYVLARPCL